MGNLTMAETPTQQLQDLGLNTLINIKDKLVEGINEILNGIAPNHTVALVFIISVTIGILLKRWRKEDNTFAVISSLLIFLSLRFLGVGN